MSPDKEYPSDHEETSHLTRSRTPKPYLHSPHEFLNPIGSRPASIYSASGDEGSTLQSRRSWRLGKSPSESGTEADDEGYVLFKALPAPPLRPRKGLRGRVETDLEAESPTPLLTPTQLEHDARRFSVDAIKSLEGESAGTDEEKRVARERFQRRRRAELTRRGCEVTLLGGIGVLVSFSGYGRAAIGKWERVELLSHGIVFLLALAVYPLRLLLYLQAKNPPGRSVKRMMRIPSSFDPAPLLYPAFLSILVILTIPAMSKQILLPNLVLSLAALPSQLFPGNFGSGYNTVHWFFSVVPLIITQNTSIPSRQHATKQYVLRTPQDGLHPESIVSLFALHQSLLPTLRYLTTTSLLSAELQLLCIGLIDLLLFSTEPQMTILSTLLWYGGLGLFVCCRHALQSNVALARVPRWKFRRAGRIIGARQSFLAALRDGLEKKGRSALHLNANETAVDSDADEDEPEYTKLPKPRKGSLRLDILGSIRQNLTHDNEPEIRSAVDPVDQRPLSAIKGILDRQRRNTLPNLTTHDDAPISANHDQEKQKKSRKSHPFLSLTPAEARLRACAYALYSYLVMVTLILGPIRHFIKKYALHGMDPFTWAVGYMFGNIQPLRFSITYWNLENWIPIPPLSETAQTSTPILNYIPLIRDYAYGAANTRLILLAYYVLILVGGLVLVLNLTILEVDTRRKVFHGMSVAMFLPTIPIDPCFVSLALALVLAVFIMLDLIRAAQLPPLSKPLARFLTPYVDGRDLRGPVVISHIFLLIGCAIPLWLSLASVVYTGSWPWQGWEVPTRDVSMTAGVICVGMGDAAASLIGRRFGRRKWPWAGGKSLEGSAAFATAVFIGLMFSKILLWLGGWEESIGSWYITLPKAFLCGCGASFMEAVLTGGNDNVIVPVVLWLLVRGVGL